MINAGAVRVPEGAGFNPGLEITVAPQLTQFQNAITTHQAGYVYVWVSNESENSKVWFDDLKITHRSSRVTQATDFYAWGNVMRENKSPEDVRYRHGYQGKFSEIDQETSWNSFQLRQLDAIIGRWTSVDPKREFSSGYLSSGNNPLNAIDPDGGDIIILNARNGAMGAGHTALLIGNNDTGWRYVSKDGTPYYFGLSGNVENSTLDGLKHRPFNTLEEFLQSDFNKDPNRKGESYYQSGLYIETDAATDSKVFESASKKALSKYDVLGSSCLHACTQPLAENSIIPGRFGGRRLPNRAYNDIADYLGRHYESDFLQFQNRYSWQTFYLEKFNFAKPIIQVGQIENLGFIPD